MMRGNEVTENLRWFDGSPIEPDAPCRCGWGARFDECCIALANRPAVDTRDSIGVYLTLDELDPRAATGPEELRKSIACFSAEDVIQTTAKLAWLYEEGIADGVGVGDLALLAPFLGPRLATKARLALNHGRAQRIAHRLLCPTIHQQALLHGGLGDGISVAGNEQSYGHMLLLANTACEYDYQARAQVDRDEERVRELVLAQVFRTGFYYESFNFGSMLGRIWAIFVGAAEPVRSLYKEEHVDLDDLALQHAGLGISHYLAMGFALLAHYLQKPDKLIRDPSRFLVGSGFLSRVETRLAPDTARRFLDSLSLDVAGFRSLLARRVGSGDAVYGNFLALHEFPFLKMAGGGYFPLDRRFLVNRLTEGIYWDLNARLRKHSPGDAHRLNAYLGRCFEWYASLLLRDGVRKAACEKVWLEWDGDFECEDGTPRPDAAVLENGTLYVMEFTAVAIVPSLAVALDFKRLRDGLARMWCSDAKGKRGKLRQLDGAISGLRAGSVRLRGFDAAAVQRLRIVPVLVTLRPLPQWLGLTRWYREIIRDEGLSELMAREVLFWECEDLETLCWAKKKRTWNGLLAARASEGKEEMSIGWFMASKGWDKGRLKALTRFMRSAGDSYAGIVTGGSSPLGFSTQN